MTWRENIERVRRGIGPIAGPGPWDREKTALAALDALAAQIEELEREVELRGLPKELMQRLHRAEREVKELEAALRKIGQLDEYSDDDNLHGSLIARVALAQSEDTG